MTLVKMPIVEGLPAFVEALNESTKNDPKRDKGFKIFAKITSDGRLGEYQVIPQSEKLMFEKLVRHLTFSNSPNEVGHVVIIVGRSKNKKKFTIVNERALMDQGSTKFKRKYSYRGAAVH